MAVYLSLVPLNFVFLNMKKALIFGIAGMDGSHMADFLLDKGYEVHGFVRRSSRGYGALENIKHLVNDDKIYRKRLLLHAGDLDDGSSIDRVVKEIQPDEIYSYAAQADVQESFLMPEYSVMINSVGPLRILEAIKRLSPRSRFYQASTSELFGDVGEHRVQNETTPFNPQSPYAIGKLAAYHLTKKYREAFGLFAVNGLTFNHCSERRTSDYLDRKVTRAVGRIKAGLQKELRLGNLLSYRDWTYAPEMVEAHWKMLQRDVPEDLVLGSGETHQVQEWVDVAFDVAGLKASDYVVSDPHLFRPAEVNILLADCSKAKNSIGWAPKVGFREIIKKMVENDIKLAKHEAYEV